MNYSIIYVPIGHTRSNQLIKIPVKRNIGELALFLDRFFIDDLLDIFCMAEYLKVQLMNDIVYDPDLRESLNQLVDIFQRLERETYFGELLESSGLKTIGDRVKLGQNLVLPNFR